MITVCLPYRAEFGWHVMMHGPQVHAVETDGPKVVYLERGMEALYPSATEYRHVDRLVDEDRRVAVEPPLLDAYEHDARSHYGQDINFVRPDHKAPRAYFVPDSVGDFVASMVDVVVCPRFRRYGPNKNWPAWPWLVERLQKSGLAVYAAGRKAASFAVDCPAAWNAGDWRELDWTIAAMRAARLVVATDNGLAHLAMLCGRPLLLVSHEDGRVAPDADDVGRPYWPIKLERYKRENHMGASITVMHYGWENPGSVVDRVVEILESG